MSKKKLGSSCLLAISIGPVQGFVSSSRKLQDLAAASGFLSYLVTHVAKGLQKKPGVELLLPPPEVLDQDSPAVANKLLLIVPGEQAIDLGEEAKSLALTGLNELGEGTLRGLGVTPPPPLWKEQLLSFLEVHWAAGPLDPAHFAESRRGVEEALNGRKTLRDFPPYLGIGGRPKSSADGFREGVFDRKTREELRRKKGLSFLTEGEQLDAIGVIRRTFPTSGWESTEKLAAAPFAKKVEQHFPALAEKALAAQKKIETLARAEKITYQLDWTEELLRTESTRRREIEHLFPAKQVPEALAAAHGEFEGTLREIINRKHRNCSPSPYYAVLMADGDRCGHRLSRLNLDGQQQMARALSSFASQAKALGHTANGLGVQVVYAGGDDVLAVASIDAALPLAESLHTAFASQLDALSRGPGEDPFTLSVGLAVVHAHDSFQNAIRLAHQAERSAKQAGGDRLGILVSRRSGGDVEVTIPFPENPRQKIGRLAHWLATQDSPHGVAYEIRHLLGELEAVDDRELLAQLLTSVLERKRSAKTGQEVDCEILGWWKRECGLAPAQSAQVIRKLTRDWTSLMLVAAQFAIYCIDLRPVE